MSKWIPFEEIEERMMQDPDFAEGVRQAEMRLKKRRIAESAQAARPMFPLFAKAKKQKLPPRFRISRANGTPA